LSAVLSLRAVPIFSDVNEFGVITNSTIEKVISKRTKVIIAVHTFGNHCDIRALRSFNLPVIEDACQAFGSFFGGSAAGSFGTLAVYSFQATKMMTTGEGGMLLTNDSEYSDFIIEDNFFNQLSPISDVQATLGLSQLSRLAEILEERNNLRNIYTQALIDLNLKNSNDPNSDVFFRFTVKVHGNIDSLIYKFADFGINIRRGVDQLLHRHFNIPDKEFQGALKIFNSTISIPFYPSLKNWEVEKIISHLPELLLND
jgi:UDP-4-amino-4-deoxy-L-arabinose-oxoglutarate aminotransferase